MAKNITLYFNDFVVGFICCDDVSVSEDSFLFGGEEITVYDVVCYLDGKIVFCSPSGCKSVDLISDKLYIEK